MGWAAGRPGRLRLAGSRMICRPSGTEGRAATSAGVRLAIRPWGDVAAPAQWRLL